MLSNSSVNKIEKTWKNRIAENLFLGAISGTVWSLIPGMISNLFDSLEQSVTVLIAGVISGIAICCLISVLFKRASWKSSILFSVLCLPLGAFIFGYSISLLQYILADWIGVVLRFNRSGNSSFSSGLELASAVFYPGLTIVILPLTILNTYACQFLV